MKNALFAVLMVGFVMTSVSFADDMNKAHPADMDANKMESGTMDSAKMDSAKMESDKSMMKKKKHMKKKHMKKDMNQ